MATPEIFVIAGPNGAGKSTTAATILPKHFPTNRFLNADDIAKALATHSPMHAGQVMLQRMRELRQKAETFAFETTLAGRTHIRFLRDAKKEGYKVHLAYIWLSNVDLAKSRVADRVREGGHDIPPADIERRYWRGVRNFFDFYRPLADTWVLSDNSAAKLVLVARQRQGHEMEVFDQDRYNGIHHAATRHK